MIGSDVGDASPLIPIVFGRQVCGDLDAAARREWLVADGFGGYAMGTVSGLRTRRYHGLLVVATDPPRGRRLALASPDPGPTRYPSVCLLAQLPAPEIVGPPERQRDDRAGRMRGLGLDQHRPEDGVVHGIVTDRPEGEAEGVGDEARA